MIASIVLGVTSFSVTSTVAAGTVSVSHPYQTPGSRVLLSAAPAALAAILACRGVFGRSHTAIMLRANAEYHRSFWSRNRVKSFLKDVLREVPHALAIDVLRVGRTIARLPVVFVRGVYIRLFGASSTPGQGSNEQTAVLDLHCISWILHTSLSKDVRLCTDFAAMAALEGFNPPWLRVASTLLLTA